MSNVKLKRLVDIYTGNSISDSDKDKYTIQSENTIPYISTKDIELGINKVNYFNDMYIDIVTNTKFKIANKGDTLLCIEGGSAGKKIARLDYDVCFVNKLCCFKGNNKIDKDFLYYYLQSGLFLSQFNLNVTGLIGGVSQSLIKEFSIPLLSKENQSKIANYLDKKVALIDETIANNKKEIELLEEYRLSVIENVVSEYETKKVKLKFLGSFQNGISANSEKFGIGDGIFINYGDVYNNYIIPDYPNGRIDLTQNEIDNYSLKYGDVLFTRTSETIDEVAISSVCLKDYPCSAFSGFVIRFRPNDLNELLPKYSEYYFKLKKHRDYFAKEMNIVTRASLSQGLLGNLEVLLPNVQNQIKISERLDKIFDEIDKIKEYRTQIIEKLEEYKKSLIYEAVTGKIEV